MWQSEACLNFGRVGCHSQVAAPSCINVKIGCCSLVDYSLLFLLGVLQAQKLLKLEEVKVKAEEELKGEVIVGSSGEVLRPLGTCTTFHPDEFPL